MSTDSVPYLTPVPPEPSQPGDEMTLVEHLLELRTRVVICAVALVISTGLCFFFWLTIVGWLLAPARESHPEFQLKVFSPTETFGVLFKVGLYGGLILASPVWLYEIIAFVTPGLTRSEKKIVLPGVIGTVTYRWDGQSIDAPYTTPTPQVLHETFAKMRDAGCTHVVMEVSSIAISMDRVAGVQFAVAAFSNLTQDHLDVHGSMEAYRDAKRRLFTDHLAGTAVVNVDDPEGARMGKAASGRVLRVTAAGVPSVDAEIRVTEQRSTVKGIEARIATPRGELDLTAKPLIGHYNVENLALAVDGWMIALDEPGHLQKADTFQIEISNSFGAGVHSMRGRKHRHPRWQVRADQARCGRISRQENGVCFGGGRLVEPLQRAGNAFGVVWIAAKRNARRDQPTLAHPLLLKALLHALVQRIVFHDHGQTSLPFSKCHARDQPGLQIQAQRNIKKPIREFRLVCNQRCIQRERR